MPLAMSWTAGFLETTLVPVVGKVGGWKDDSTDHVAGSLKGTRVFDPSGAQLVGVVVVPELQIGT